MDNSFSKQGEPTQVPGLTSTQETTETTTTGATMSGFLPGNISLVEQLDKKILVVLRDGRHLVGYVRSFDQYSNIILEDTFERHVAGGLFCDIELGLNIIRGDNIVLLGELDEEKERDQPHMKRASMEEVLEAEERLHADGASSVRAQWGFDAAGL